MAWSLMWFSYNEAMRPSPSTNCARERHAVLDFGELSTLAEDRLLILGGDFNAHHPSLSSTQCPNAAGNHLHLTLNSSDTALLNDGSPTHVRGGRLDLTLVTATLFSRARWEIHPAVTNDHFGVCMYMRDVALPLVVPHIPRWNTSKVNWSLFSNALASWATGYNPLSWDVDSLKEDISAALDAAANGAIPLQGQPTRRHKNHWYYNEEMREASHRVCMFRRSFRQNRTQVTLANLRKAVCEVHATGTRAKISKFHEWCEGFNTHTPLSELWRKFHVTTNRFLPHLTHHAPVKEAQRLVEEFASRTSSAFLPQRAKETQQQLREGQIQNVRDMMAQLDETNTELPLRELTAVRRPDKYTAPSEDRVTYSILAHLGPAGDEVFLSVVNASWRTGRLPTAWKTATIVPIPKPKVPGAFRSISSVSCMEKTAEKIMLNRLL
ncbi:uncharacterized protein LOC143021849 [Oratosquilla oratoria]|uniref:uncharacterized protein LOC143021849 n=1 Tax=Oratosquilla oratoria TaxID=337810 RepID=UPI003F759C28